MSVRRYNFFGGHAGYIEYSFINVGECGVVVEG